MNRLLIVGVLLLSTVPLWAQAQRPNTAKLTADAQKAVSDIRGDKAKTQAYCQINSLGAQMVEAAQEKDSKKAEALFQRVDDLWVPNTTRCSMPFMMRTPTPKMFRISCRCSISSTNPVRSNSIKKCRRTAILQLGN